MGTSKSWSVRSSEFQGLTTLTIVGTRFSANFHTTQNPKFKERDEAIKADAHLIAAAPELLEALKEAQQHINGGSGIKQGMEWKAMYDKIRAAIAKAEGAEQ